MMTDWTLTAADRCDACGARAYVRVTVKIELSDLTLCRHHALKHEAKLRAVCVDWVDETDMLHENRTKAEGAHV